MTYDNLCAIARVAGRWQRNTDPRMEYIRKLTRHNFLCASYEYWCERGYQPDEWLYNGMIDREFAYQLHNQSAENNA